MPTATATRTTTCCTILDYRRDQHLHVAGERIAHADGHRELLIP
ncbi:MULTISPECIES: hypothetical protein [Burkholderia]|uniref:Uncharacterized protein n=1 Tax=Burkholderia orbicola TaxID=2978683 RepID=A0ABT8NV27_9BURK|nr:MULTISPECIES: hypothetical protein [Burkholderia]ESS40327.1 hypothetical protein P355_2779 [Burkholderia cenocepacia KC-01]MDN7482199.1 hypothetical protein [Burkholderia orbicola]MDN7525446.1 hypothetical protein [Burkholderia orbicola]MDN7532270.1 hypothetical protein [Burkholderia orbicola]MDN7729285.1 hypothetical protein [Burkholderia orbicola]